MKEVGFSPVVFAAIFIFLLSSSSAAFAQASPDLPKSASTSAAEHGAKNQGRKDIGYSGSKPYPSKKSYSGYSPSSSNGSYSGYSPLPSSKSYSGYSPSPEKGSYSGYSPYSTAEHGRPAPTASISPTAPKKGIFHLGPYLGKEQTSRTQFGPYAPGSPESTWHSGPYAPDIERAEQESQETQK